MAAPYPVTGQEPWGVALKAYIDGEDDDLVAALTALITARTPQIPVLVRKTANTTRTATIVQASDPDLTVNLLASTNYKFRAVVFYTSPSATGDLRLGMSFNTGASGRYAVYGQGVSAASSDSSATFRSTAHVLNANVFLGGAGATEMSAVVEGVILNGVNAGPLALQWAQATSDAGNTVVMAGSYLEVTAIP